jgi:hypothetical protein
MSEVEPRRQRSGLLLLLVFVVAFWVNRTPPEAARR